MWPLLLSVLQSVFSFWLLQESSVLFKTFSGNFSGVHNTVYELELYCWVNETLNCHKMSRLSTNWHEYRRGYLIWQKFDINANWTLMGSNQHRRLMTRYFRFNGVSILSNSVFVGLYCVMIRPHNNCIDHIIWSKENLFINNVIYFIFNKTPRAWIKNLMLKPRT